MHYSIEGKHIFMELVRPSKSVDFHAGAKDTAEEIVSALGEIAGAVKAEGLKEVLAAGAGADRRQKRGQVLYDFVAQGDDEVTVEVGDEVVILDDTKSEEWWMIRRTKNGKEGVMPSSYVEITNRSSFGLDSIRSTVEQNRLEEEMLTKQVTKSKRGATGNNTLEPEVGLGVKLPKRGSSLMSRDNTDARVPPSKSRESKQDTKPLPTSKSSKNSLPQPEYCHGLADTV